ncbi:MAG: radical SAM protein [Magnetococcales bacterium]|nr:radical SAM protein [Magnetococcales bacterium]
MKTYALSMDKNLVAIGFRRVVAAARAAGFDIQSIFFLDNIKRASLSGSWWKQNTDTEFSVNYVKNDEAIINLAKILADADNLIFSTMSVQSKFVQDIIRETKKLNPKIVTLVGGYHPTIFPKDAIEFADVICLGEGERTLIEFLKRVQNGEPFDGLPNSWFKRGEEIIKNPQIPLLTQDELDAMPYMDTGLQDNFIFSLEEGKLYPQEQKDVIQHLGTTYNTIWSVGCPFVCSFCSQDTMISLNKGFAKHRGRSPRSFVDEIKEGIKLYPTDYVIFWDSDFWGRNIEDLREFTRLYRDEVGLKFVISGSNPVSIKEEKLDLLLEAGLVRIKMGFEGGNEEILKILKRAGRTKKLREATKVLASRKNTMVAPSFEMILDNPLETTDQLYQTLDFLFETPGPYTLNLFSMHFMPGTALSELCTDEIGVEEEIDKEYMFSYQPTHINNLISILAIFKPPRFLFNFFKKMIKGREHVKAPKVKKILYHSMLVRRAFNQARFGDYTTFPYWVMVYYHKWRLFKNRLFGNRGGKTIRGVSP